MDIIEIARVVFSLTFVVGLIGLVAIAAKRLGLQNGAITPARSRRLALVEQLPIDQRRRAAIISCDGREHLIILDASRVTVIERGLPPRENEEIADPIAARATAFDAKALFVPQAALSLIKRAPRDKTAALRAAGLI